MTGDPRVPAIDKARRGVPAGRAAAAEPHIAAARLPPRGHREETRGVQDTVPRRYQGPLPGRLQSLLRRLRQQS